MQSEILWGQRAVVLACLLLFAAVCFKHADVGGLRIGNVNAAPRKAPDVLYVFQYDGEQDWQTMRVDEPYTSDVVAWLLGIRDRLTRTSQNPIGNSLMVCLSCKFSTAVEQSNAAAQTDYQFSCASTCIPSHMSYKGLLQIPWQFWMPKPAEHLRVVNEKFQDVSLTSILDVQLCTESATILLPKSLMILHQLSLISGGPSLTKLHITTANTFWHVVEATAEADQLVHKPDIVTDAQQVISILDSVVMLPTMDAVHGQDKWHGTHVSEAYGDHTLWDVDTICLLLRHFVQISGARTLPDIEEYAWRLDKVAMLQVYQEHHKADSLHTAAPIPSVVVHVPVTHDALAAHCYSARYTPEQTAVTREHVHATALALLQAAWSLEADSDAQQIQANNQARDSSQGRRYFLKRNYAGVSSHVGMFNLTVLHNQPRGSNGSLDRALLANKVFPSITSRRQQGQEDIGIHEASVNAELHDAHQLFQAAEHVIKTSCQEAWLLQPFMPDMDRNEYRVYLIGGLDAKVPEDIAAVFTPVYYEATGNKRLPIGWHVTLPPDFFSRAAMTPEQDQVAFLRSWELIAQLDTNSSHVDEYYDSNFPYPIWRDKAMHDLLVHTAFDAARAIAKSGRPIRTGQHVMLRVDIAMTNQDRMAKAFINEAHVFNDAALYFDVWSSGQGLQLARKVWQEVLALVALGAEITD